MAVDKEALICLSRVYSYYFKCNFPLFYVYPALTRFLSILFLNILTLLACVVTLEVHMSSLRRLICPAWDHFVFLTLLIISDFVLSLTHMLVFLSLHVILLNTSFHFCLCGSKFVMCLLVTVKCSRRYRSWKIH